MATLNKGKTELLGVTEPLSLAHYGNAGVANKYCKAHLFTV